MDPAGFLDHGRQTIDAVLDRLLPPEDAPPAVLHRAMRYSVFAGGKRLRPLLALAAARLGELSEPVVAPAAAALELIHTYSLIHDDLPAMDDDDLRRGKPTCHVVFGQGQAILAGDALLTLAFEVLAREPKGAELAGRRLLAIERVAVAAGQAGMVGGQSADLEAEHSRPDDPAATLLFIHRRKTGALIAASAALGAILGGLGPAEVDTVERAGRAIGLAFQIADDILDVEGSSAELGKTAGKDARAEKLTYPAVHGLEASRRQAVELSQEAVSLLEPFGPSAAALAGLARLAVERRS